MIVAGEREHAAVARCAGGVGVLERFHRPIDAGALAVPDAEYAIDLGARKQADLLAAPDRRRRQHRFKSGHEGDIVGLQKRLRPPERVVVHAERRAAIAGYEARGIEVVRAIALPLQQRQPTRAWMPDRYIRLASGRYLSSNPTCISDMRSPSRSSNVPHTGQ